ncbi:MFS transporter [Lactococcus sp.]|uniref:MFS transporter n=1 Tax=Lactococcus sp. TaxID=44273 RepID=UPI0035B14573
MATSALLKAGQSAKISNEKNQVQVGKAVPVLLFLMIFSLVIDNSFKIISPELVTYFHASATTVSWQVTLAGLVIGMGAVVYASLSSAISIKKLLIVGISLISFGSILGYIFHQSLVLVVLSRVIQASGLGATETLYLIFVARYIDKDKQKKYMGFSTSAFQLATVIGTLTGGFITTNLAWQDLFLVPLLTLLVIPFILKYLPKETGEKKRVDIIGMILVAGVAVSVMIYITDFNWLYLGVFALVFIAFLTYISKVKSAFISIEFFKNKLYVYSLLVNLLIYSVQAAFILNTFSFLMTNVYRMNLSTIALLFIPASLASALVGSLSGAIAKVFNSFMAILISMLAVLVAIVIAALSVGTSSWIMVGMLLVTSCAFAMLYAPLLHTSIDQMPENDKGTAIGFYNLVINIAMAVGFTYSSKLIDGLKLQLPFTAGGTAGHYAGVLLVIALVAVVSLLIFVGCVGREMKKNFTAK